MIILYVSKITQNAVTNLRQTEACLRNASKTADSDNFRYIWFKEKQVVKCSKITKAPYWRVAYTFSVTSGGYEKVDIIL